MTNRCPFLRVNFSLGSGDRACQAALAIGFRSRGTSDRGRKPSPVRLGPVEAAPERIGEKQVTVRRTERDALGDLRVLLRLTDQGKVQVSDKTSLPGSATLRLPTEHLANGDFHGRVGGNSNSETGPLKAFSWLKMVVVAATCSSAEKVVEHRPETVRIHTCDRTRRQHHHVHQQSSRVRR